MHHVFFIPGKNRTYHACIAEAPPSPTAIFLIEELDYPVTVWWHRHDLNMDPIRCSESCQNREELITLLDFLGQCGHAVDHLWDYHDETAGNQRITELFDICYQRKIEEIAEQQKLLEEFD